MKKSYLIGLLILTVACGGTSKTQLEKETEIVSTKAALTLEAMDIVEGVPTPTIEISPVETTVETQKGTFTVPGKAFLDGIDKDAQPPLTVMKINIWDSVTRNKVVCKLEHGNEVSILESKFLNNENRYYFKVLKDNCSGWLSEPFLSPVYREVEGDLFY